MILIAGAVRKRLLCNVARWSEPEDKLPKNQYISANCCASKSNLCRVQVIECNQSVLPSDSCQEEGKPTKHAGFGPVFASICA